MNRTKSTLVLCFLWFALLLPTARLLAYRDLETGTFITRDPAGMVDGPNLYAYVRQNPWTKFDPKGLQEGESDPKEEYEDPMLREAREGMRNPEPWEIRENQAQGQFKETLRVQRQAEQEQEAKDARDYPNVPRYMRSVIRETNEANARQQAETDAAEKGGTFNGGSPSGKSAKQQSEENQKKIPNPAGSKGKEDHQQANKELMEEMEAKYPDADLILSNRSIKGQTGLNRRPDAMVVKDGDVIAVGEVARTNKDGSIVSREQKKQDQYEAAGIPSTVKKLPPTEN